MKLVLRIFDKVLRIIENARVKYSGLNSGGGGGTLACTIDFTLPKI